MPDQAPVQMPEIKPGMLVWGGRFRNRPYYITKVFSEEGKLKYEMVAVPQGRKHPKVRNILPFKPMNAEDSAKYKKMYEDDQRERRSKAAAVAARHQDAKVVSRYLEAVSETRLPSMRAQAGKAVWASECGKYRIQDTGAGQQRFQVQFKIGRSWYDDYGWPNLKVALREIRALGDQ